MLVPIDKGRPLPESLLEGVELPVDLGRDLPLVEPAGRGAANDLAEARQRPGRREDGIAPSGLPVVRFTCSPTPTRSAWGLSAGASRGQCGMFAIAPVAERRPFSKRSKMPRLTPSVRP